MRMWAHAGPRMLYETGLSHGPPKVKSAVLQTGLNKRHDKGKVVLRHGAIRSAILVPYAANQSINFWLIKYLLIPKSPLFDANMHLTDK